MQEKYQLEGRDTVLDHEDPRILQRLGKLSLTLASKLEDGQELVLNSISNLSAGGTSVDVAAELHEKWAQLAAFIAKGFSLRLCGVDLACADITKSDTEYSVLEVNAAPGLDHYAATGYEQKRIVDALYTKVLNAYP